MDCFLLIKTITTFIVLLCGSTVDLRWVISAIFFLPEAWTFSVATETQVKTTVWKTDRMLWRWSLSGKRWALQNCLEWLSVITSVGLIWKVKTKWKVWWLFCQTEFHPKFALARSCVPHKRGITQRLMKHLQMKTDFGRGKSCEIEWNEGLLEKLTPLYLHSMRWGRPSAGTNRQNGPSVLKAHTKSRGGYFPFSNAHSKKSNPDMIE